MLAMILLLIDIWAEHTRCRSPIMIDQDMRLYDLHVIENNYCEDCNRADKDDPFHIASGKPAGEMQNQDGYCQQVYDVKNHPMAPLCY